MKLALLLAAAATTLLAAPYPAPEVEVTFHGAAASFQESFSLANDQPPSPIGTSISVTSITLSGDVTCNFYAEDGTLTTVASVGDEVTQPVGPPQPQVSASCRAGGQ